MWLVDLCECAVTLEVYLYKEIGRASEPENPVSTSVLCGYVCRGRRMGRKEFISRFFEVGVVAAPNLFLGARGRQIYG